MTATAWAAFIRRDWRIARSYRFPFIAAAIGGLVSIALFYYLSTIVRRDRLPAGSGRAQGYFAFALVGLILMQLLVVGIYAVARRVREEQIAGTLEAVVATPTPTWLIAVGSASYELLWALGSGAASAIAAEALFGVQIDLRGAAVPSLIAALIATFALACALGIAVAALTILFKQTTAITSALAVAVALLSGVYFPTANLPSLLRSISWASPFRWSLDVVRPALYNGHIPPWELAGLCATAAAALPLAIAAFAAALSRARKTGTLAQY